MKLPLPAALCLLALPAWAQVASPPVCSPGAGTYSNPQFVPCSNPNSGTTIMCYTMGSTPPATDGTGLNCAVGIQYVSPVAVAVSQTMNVVAGTSTLSDSPVVNYAYTITNPSSLPQVYVDPLQATQLSGKACPTFDVTLQLGYGTNDYPASQAGINSALNAWAADTDKCYHIQIVNQTAGGGPISGATTITVPAKAGATKYAVVDSSTPLPPYRITCSHGFTDPWGPTPGTRNPGCVGDAASMYHIQTTTTVVPIVFAPGSNHVVFMNGEVTPLVTSTSQDYVSLVQLGDGSETTVATLPSYVGLTQMYIHGYDPPPLNPTAGVHGTQIHHAVMMNCVQCYLTYSYIEQIHDTGIESHSVSAWNTPGPLLVAMNWVEAGSVGMMIGGARSLVYGIQTSDVEVRRNRWSRDITWTALTGTLCSPSCPQHWGVKDNFELKSVQRILFDGNIYENSWADAQSGELRINNPTDYHNPNSIVADITETNEIFRHAAEGMQIAPLSPPTESGGMIFGTDRELYQNLVFYDISDTSVYGNGNDELTYGGGNGAGVTYFVSAQRDSAGLTSTYVVTGDDNCPSCSELYPLLQMQVGVPIPITGCADTTFNTVSAFGAYAEGPYSLTGTQGYTVVIPNTGIANATTTGCVLGANGMGWPNHATYNHITAAFGDSFKYMDAAGAGFPRNFSMNNNLFVSTNSSFSGFICSGKSEGTQSEDGCFETGVNSAYGSNNTFALHNNVFQGRTASNYKGYAGGGASGVTPDTLDFYPANIGCTSPTTPDATCIGFTGFMNGATYPPSNFGTNFDYHNLILLPNSVFAAGQASDASDGASVGANISVIDTALGLNQYGAAGFFPLAPNNTVTRAQTLLQ